VKEMKGGMSGVSILIYKGNYLNSTLSTYKRVKSSNGYLLRQSKAPTPKPNFTCGYTRT